MSRSAVASLARPLARQPTALPARRYASHGPSYNPPSGYIFGERPPKDGKRVKESWENIYYVGMFGGMALMGIVYAYKPDTSIQTWALKEARERLEARGEEYQYKPKTA
ncbi:hypothetical protein L202_03669 [Cryptococcus amylolentus CBS 6039]|uniref:NADH dehydrogenase [ubiquinone] 1 beta subcomplex subunit 11, mitochondrial n=2 Tax=Cryptococcus amylolentus TaxID=104669 RepID=A0A1E3HTS9_9TREE|nr:hypothetical protein L202_03669 [Cryptococcus amylolentus CBS 6039]ODN79757.1 hypothetical protein L202_03669 [Cryptococcus amylolentus CBS 6039]ODO08045.1 hypothetical protein I350_03628 [Cryptococcus amylolentus CBS 6273]